ncbi:MAG: secretin and TonB N-terminal domain-containing protein [Fimbriimonadaceae bacterium]
MRSDLLRVAICGAALALAGQAVAEGQLKGVETRTFAQGTKLQIIGKGLGKPTIVKGNGNSTIFTFQANLPGSGKKVAWGKDGLKAFRYYWYKSNPRLVRVQVWPENGNTKPIATKNSEGWVVTWNAGLAKPTPNIVQSPDTQLSSKPIVSPLQATDGKAAKPQPKGAQTTDAGSKPKLMLSHSLKTDKSKKPTPAKAKASAKPKIKTVVTKTKWVPAPVKPLADTFRTDTGKKIETPKKPRKVSVQFVNTDVVQVLKALAMQSRVNIVTSPDVKGNVTVSLENVTVTEALDLVTTLTSLSYELVNGNTYIVALPEKIAGMRGLIEKRAVNITSNVIPIFSGEGTQIKAAILRTVPANTADGSFEIVLPSEETKVEKKTEDKTGGAGADTGKTGEGDKTSVETKSTSGDKDMYVVVMGSPSRVKEVSSMVTALDAKFCETLGKDIPTSTMMVRKAYQVRGGSAQELMKAVAGDSKKLGNVEISATPSGSTSDQAIVLFGREHEVNWVLQTLGQLDSTDQIGDEFIMYEVNFADPRSLRESLVAQVPGLRASIPPASAGNPRLYRAGDSKAMASDMTKDDPTKNKTSGTPATVGIQLDPKPTRDTGTVTEGLASPYTNMEQASVPMKLLLRGTQEQLSSARAYLAMVDVAPKQVALELRVMELSKDEAFRLGIDWNIFSGGAVSLIRFNQSSAVPGSNQGTIRISGDNFGANITATLDDIAGRQRMIARPNLFAIDGRESEIFVGDIVRYVASKSTNPTTGELQITIEEVPVGVRLAVLPRIGGSGSITMDLRPVVSSITGYLNAGGGILIPQTSSRIAQSTVNIMSGETIAIGGLIQESDTRSVSKVPILGDLPIIGALFRRTDNTKTRREVVFFLTAREVSASNRQNAADPRVGEKVNPTEMPPIKGNVKTGGG